MTDLIERLYKAAADFEAARDWHGGAEDGDCEPHWSIQGEMEEAAKTAREAAAALEAVSPAPGEPAHRIETGPVRIGDDWAGVFIRGDRALFFAMMARAGADALRKVDAIAGGALDGLAKTLGACREPCNAVPLYASPPTSPGEPPQGWKDISTAPKDGTILLVYRRDAGVFCAHFANSFEPGDIMPDLSGDPRWFSVHGEDLTDDMPTHWQPLPASPSTGSAE